MKGGTRKRGKTWSYYFDAAAVGGKRKKIEKGGFRTKKEAEAALAKALSEYNRAGTVFEPSNISVGDYLDEWLEQYSVNTGNPLKDEKRLDELAKEWNALLNSIKFPIDNVTTKTRYTDSHTQKGVLERVQGCLFGMAAGAWLNAITREYSPSENAFSSLVWNIPFTWKPDDGIELALALANSLIKEKMFKPEAVYYAYLTWMLSRPFKENRPILTGIGEKTSTLLRTAVLACFGRNCELTQVIHWCALNVKITHPDPICVFANEIYAVAVFFALKSGNPEELYEKTIEWGFKSENQEKTVLEALLRASTSPPNAPS